jgi:phosphoribosylformylglycinamidine cyclo-ligase
VGAVDRSRIIDGSRIQTGDLVIGLPSVGLHTNGYSLARKLFFEVAGYKPDTKMDELDSTVAEELLKPHRSYLGALEGLLDSGAIKGLAHITGGGLVENIPRILPEGTAVKINQASWPVLAVYRLLQRIGNVPEPEMYRTFNMGIGMVIIASPKDADPIREHLDERGEPHYDIGRVAEGSRTVSIV